MNYRNLDDVREFQRISTAQESDHRPKNRPVVRLLGALIAWFCVLVFLAWVSLITIGLGAAVLWLIRSVA